MTVYSEETLEIPVGLGLDSFNHPAHISEGFCTQVDNFIAYGDRLVTRKGFKPPTGMSGLTFTHFNTNGVWYTQFPQIEDLDLPAAMWGGGSGSSVFALRQFKRGDAAAAAAATGNGYAEFSAENTFRGGVVYLDTVYLNINGNIEKVSSINWSAQTITSTVVSGAPTATVGLFSFKDRLWTWDLYKIYFTDVPASAGGLPETWSTSDNFLTVTSNAGMGIIYSVIPLDTKLFCFTSNGIYTVSVIGSTPAQWVIRLLDGSHKVNTRSCSYEYRGLIFFVDQNGVWVTDGSTIKNISRDVEDFFKTPASDDTFHYFKLTPFENGILVCRNTTFHSSGSTYIQTDAEIMFTRLDNIAWSKFTFPNHTKQPGDIIGSFDRLETFGKAPTSYLVMASGTSDTGTPASITAEILEYTGFQDNIASEGLQDVKATFRTRLLRPNLFKSIRAKYGYLNYSSTGTDDTSALELTYSWDTEETASISSRSETASIEDDEEGVLKLKANFYFRHVIGQFVATLSSAIQEYTFLRVGLILHTGRNEPRLQS